MLTFPVVLISYFKDEVVRVLLISYFEDEVRVLFANLQEMLGVGFPENVHVKFAVFRYFTFCSSSGERMTVGISNN